MSAVDDLRALLGERLSTSPAIRDQHGGDIMHAPRPPDAVAFAQSTSEVSDMLRICSRHRWPVIPFGAGTSVEGQLTAPHGGLSLDLSLMTNVVSFNPRDMDITVEAGMTREALGVYLRDSGLFFPVDPGANATLGGMAATRAAGTTTPRYGTMRENVMGLRAVLMDGTVIHTGSRARKSAAGYDLTRLFVGSEGTLGVITEVTLRLFGVPEAISAATCSFPDMDHAVRCVIATLQSGVPMARMEFIDHRAMAALNRYSGLNLPESPSLFLEFHGSVAAVEEQARQVEALAREFGTNDFRWAVKPEERTKLWKARHEAAFASMALKPGSERIGTDICVPVSKLAACLAETEADLAASGLTATVGGHVGDGNFHVMLLISPGDRAERAAAEAFHDSLVRRSLAMQGTCTGEHGVGTGKMSYLKQEYGPEGIAVMQRLKAALDPQGLMNPGKIFAPA